MTPLEAWALGFAFSLGVGLTLWSQGRLSFYAAVNAAVVWPLTWLFVGLAFAALCAMRPR